MGTEIFETVLLVEDDPGHAHIIKRALRLYAQEVRHAPDISSALGELASYAPNLIVMDLHLPDSTGAGDVERLAAAGREVPVMVLTSSTSLKDAVDAMKAGARDFIVKNFDGDFKEVLGFSLSRVYASILLEEEKRKLKQEMEILRVAIENSNDGLAVVNPAGDVRYANRAFHSFARSCGGAAGNVCDMLSPQLNKYSSLRESVRGNLLSLSAGASWHTEITFVADAAAAFDMSISVVGAGGDRSAKPEKECVVWIRDVSGVKRREKFQREILSTTSHDLKGPLGSIALSSELLSEMLEKNGKPYEIALRIGSSAQGAIHLIDEFLSARRIQEGTFILKPTLQNIRELVLEVVDNYKAVAASKRIELQVDVAAGCQSCLDRLGFCRVVGNLLSNAFKFTPKGGGVQVRAQVVESELHLEVEDSGSGMEPSEVKVIFDRFTRLERHGEVAGTGIGLFIVKSIVAAHGGEIEVTSQVNKGTTFKVKLPLAPPLNKHGELISLDFA
jgi:signal transduction histidine kinase/ActR/RegA family two-component response regulator